MFDKTTEGLRLGGNAADEIIKSPPNDRSVFFLSQSTQYKYTTLHGVPTSFISCLASLTEKKNIPHELDDCDSRSGLVSGCLTCSFRATLHVHPNDEEC